MVRYDKKWYGMLWCVCSFRIWSSTRRVCMSWSCPLASPMVWSASHRGTYSIQHIAYRVFARILQHSHTLHFTCTCTCTCTCICLISSQLRGWWKYHHFFKLQASNFCSGFVLIKGTVICAQFVACWMWERCSASGAATATPWGWRTRQVLHCTTLHSTILYYTVCWLPDYLLADYLTKYLVDWMVNG